MCSGRLICDKIRGGVVFVEKNERRRRNGGEGEEGCSLGYKLNITNGFNMHSIKRDFFVHI
jgi:hypothetical protein